MEMGGRGVGGEPGQFLEAANCPGAIPAQELSLATQFKQGGLLAVLGIG